MITEEELKEYETILNEDGALYETAAAKLIAEVRRLNAALDRIQQLLSDSGVEGQQVVVRLGEWLTGVDENG
jgi:hypothetical protein